MEYAVVLYFDQASENKLLDLMKKLVDGGMNDYMIKNKIPPHITLTVFRKEDDLGIKQIVQEFATRLYRQEVFFSSIGVFNPRVIFLASVMNEFLLNACVQINKAMQACTSDFASIYLPNQWVPHVALGVRLEANELTNAFGVLQKEFTTFQAMVAKVAVIECNPYRDICCFDL